MYYLYAHFPYGGDHHSGLIQVFYREDKAAKFALDQIKFHLDTAMGNFARELVPEQINIAMKAVHNKDAATAIKEYETYLKSVGQESTLHELRRIKIAGE